MEPQKPEPKSDDIDLGRLFSRIGAGIHGTWMGGMRLLATLRRVPLENKFLFGSIIVAVVILGVVFRIGLAKNYYESKMIFSSDYLNNKLASSMVDNLNALTGEKSKAGLAEALNLPDSVAGKINGFEIIPFIDKTDVVLEVEILKEQLRATRVPANKVLIEDILERIELEDRHAYEITVRTLSPSIIGTIQEAVVNYFRRNPYIQKRIEINKVNLTAMKANLSRDINKLDSLKRALYTRYESSGSQASSTVYVAEKSLNPAEIFTEGAEVYRLYNRVSMDLYTQKDFEVIDGFTHFTEPANSSLTRTILNSLLIGLLIAYFVVALRNFNRYLANLQ